MVNLYRKSQETNVMKNIKTEREFLFDTIYAGIVTGTIFGTIAVIKTVDRYKIETGQNVKVRTKRVPVDRILQYRTEKNGHR